jgi:MOSC domain-containing protein YiiM
MQVLSVNIGKIEVLPQGKKQTKSGICKYPVSGPLPVSELGLDGDKIADKRYHGGPDQAVYLYSREDYAWWENQLGRSLPFGIFGENITLSNFGPQPARIGDVWQLGNVTLQLTAPRIPCATLAARMGDPSFLKAFVKANRGGAYARVLQPGTVQAGDAANPTTACSEAPAIDELFELFHQSPKDRELMRRALDHPLAERIRATLEKWLEKTT